MEQHQNLLHEELRVDSSIQNHLKETAGWAKFLGIVGFILSGLLAVVAILLPSLMNKMTMSPYSSYNKYGSELDSAFRAGITAAYLIAAGILFLVAMFTFKFGDRTKRAFLNNDQVSLDQGLKNLKFLFRFYGVVAIIYIGLFILAMLGVAAAGLR